MNNKTKRTKSPWPELEKAGLCIDVGGPKGAHLKDVAAALLREGFNPSVVLDVIVAVDDHDRLHERIKELEAATFGYQSPRRPHEELLAAMDSVKELVWRHANADIADKFRLAYINAKAEGL